MNQKNILRQIARVFKVQGGRFYIPPEKLAEVLGGIRGFIFDWDGVFHSGHKGEGRASMFSEADSMGINLLRYGYWLKNNEFPYVAIISGQGDATAVKFAGREHLTACYLNINNKKEAVEHASHTADLHPGQIACVFDDVNDLSMSKICGLRIKVKRNASPLFARYTVDHALCDYVTGHFSHEHAVREVCELLLGLSGIYDRVIESRVAFDAAYQRYWQARNKNKSNYYTGKDGAITLIEERIHTYER